jgi:hypothetical protein
MSTLFLPKVKSFGEEIGGAIGSGFGEGLEKSRTKKEEESNKLKMRREIEEENAEIEKDTGIKMPRGMIDPKMRQVFVSEELKNKNKKDLQQNKLDFASRIFNKNSQSNVPQGTQQDQINSPQQMQEQFNPLDLSDQDIIGLTAVDPALGREARMAKDSALKEQRHNQDVERQTFESERKYNTDFSKKAEEEVEGIRNSLSKKEFSLNLSRDAVESGEVGALSLANLAQRLGVPEWQSMKGAQLETAIKENLLSNMSRVSAKGQNLWFEKRLSSMMAQIGKSQEANLAAQEILEGETAMDRSYLENFDRLANDDMEKYGFVKKDISKRSHDAAKHEEKDILKRTSYRLKELEEQEKGLSNMKARIGKNVTKGEPLTLAMAKLYKDKFGNDALKVAEKNGYYIPSIEEFSTFRATPQEFREDLQ